MFLPNNKLLWCLVPLIKRLQFLSFVWTKSDAIHYHNGLCPWQIVHVMNGVHWGFVVKRLTEPYFGLLMCREMCTYEDWTLTGLTGIDVIRLRSCGDISRFLWDAALWRRWFTMVMYEHLKNIWLQSLTEDFLLRLAQTDPSRSSGHVYHRFTVRPGILKARVKAMRARKVRCDIGIRQRLKYLSGGVAATL